jgi:hypothetical protein
LLEEYNPYWETTDSTGWHSTTDLLREIDHSLKGIYGIDGLYVKDSTDQRLEVNLEDFFNRTYPSRSLDIVELFYAGISNEQKILFQRDFNSISEEEGCDWRLTDGQFFQVNSEFLALQVIARSYELMKAEGYEGALDEFNEARNDLASGDFKGAIQNACKSFESTLKIILERQTGNASNLIRGLFEAGIYSDLPEEVGRAFGDSVLMALPFLRNRLGGHGQGQEKLEFSRSYAELAVNLAGSFIHFSISRSLELAKGGPEENEGD